MTPEDGTGVVGATVTGHGWAAGNVDAMGEGPGFRKVRRELGVTPFGDGEGDGDGESVVLGPGGMARVDGFVGRDGITLDG